MSSLSTPATAVLDVLRGLPGGVTRDSNASLAERAGISASEASRAISELERLNLIDVQRTKMHRVLNPTGRIIIVNAVVLAGGAS